MGLQLDGLSFKELQHLEHQLSAGILSVKDKKVNKFYNEQLLFVFDHILLRLCRTFAFECLVTHC
jgi:hypothetical protein